MNRRTLKKHCARVRDRPIAEHGYKPEDFDRATGEETFYAPPHMERRFCWHGFLEPGPLKGTWLLWEQDSYGEGDYALPSEVLRHIELWRNMTDDEIVALLA